MKDCYEVYFVGGPADLTKQVLYMPPSVWDVPELPRTDPLCRAHTRPSTEPVLCKIHRYRMASQVGPHTLIYVLEEILR